MVFAVTNIDKISGEQFFHNLSVYRSSQRQRDEYAREMEKYLQDPSRVTILQPYTVEVMLFLDYGVFRKYVIFCSLLYIYNHRSDHNVQKVLQWTRSNHKFYKFANYGHYLSSCLYLFHVTMIMKSHKNPSYLPRERSCLCYKVFFVKVIEFV